MRKQDWKRPSQACIVWINVDPHTELVRSGIYVDPNDDFGFKFGLALVMTMWNSNLPMQLYENKQRPDGVGGWEMVWDGGEMLVGFVAETDAQSTAIVTVTLTHDDGSKISWSLHVHPGGEWMPAYRGITVLPKISRPLQKYTLTANVRGRVHIVSAAHDFPHRATLASPRRCTVRRHIELCRPLSSVPSLDLPPFDRQRILQHKVLRRWRAFLSMKASLIRLLMVYLRMYGRDVRLDPNVVLDVRRYL